LPEVNEMMSESTQNVERDNCHGKPSTSRNDELVVQVYDSVQNHIRLIIRGSQISYGSSQETLTKDLEMKHINKMS
jgi:hypothetical protein